MSVHGIQALIAGMPEILRYVYLFGFSLIENFLFWLPGDVSTVAGALLAATGLADAAVVLLVVSLGAWGAFLLFFELSRRIDLTRRLPAKQHGRLATAFNCLSRFGSWLLLVHRFLPGFRTAVAVAGGLVAWPRRRVWALSLCGIIAENAVVMGVTGGFVTLAHLVPPGAAAMAAYWPLWLGAALAVAAVLARKWMRRSALRRRPV